MSALVHDARCEREDPVDWDSCRCAERALTAARQREEEAKGEIARLKWERDDIAYKVEHPEFAHLHYDGCPFKPWSDKYDGDIPDPRPDCTCGEAAKGAYWKGQHMLERGYHELTRRELDALRAENDRLTLAASESALTLQVRIAELEAGERHCDEYHGELADQVTALREALEKIKDRMGRSTTKWDGPEGALHRECWELAHDACVLALAALPQEHGQQLICQGCGKPREMVNQPLCDACRKALPQDGA